MERKRKTARIVRKKRVKELEKDNISNIKCQIIDRNE